MRQHFKRQDACRIAKTQGAFAQQATTSFHFRPPTESTHYLLAETTNNKEPTTFLDAEEEDLTFQINPDQGIVTTHVDDSGTETTVFLDLILVKNHFNAESVVKVDSINLKNRTCAPVGDGSDS